MGCTAVDQKPIRRGHAVQIKPALAVEPTRDSPRVALHQALALLGGWRPRWAVPAFGHLPLHLAVDVLRHLQRARKNEPTDLTDIDLDAATPVELRELPDRKRVRLPVLVAWCPAEIEHHAPRPQLRRDLGEDDDEGEFGGHQLGQCKAVPQVIRDALQHDPP